MHSEYTTKCYCVERRIVLVLFEPICINSLKLKNRIVMTAMHLGYCEKGFVTDRLIDFYKERAGGGVGLITVGGCAIDLHGYRSMIRVDDDRYVPGLARLVSAVKESGAAVCAQLFQPGRYGSNLSGGLTPVAPSAIEYRATGQIPRELTPEEIYSLVDCFANSASRVKEAGFDAVEVIGSAGYLISQFLSPLTNHREDSFGGGLEGRIRFGIMVASRIREKLGTDFPLIFRISGSEFMPGGSTRDDIKYFCAELEKAGVDALNVTGGWHETKVPQISMEVPRGAFAYLARQVKDAVSIPVIACNRINDPYVAESIVSDGIADMVGMGRGLIADPQLPLKAEAERFGEIRKCVGCNQGCLESVFASGSVRCLVNARAGREDETVIYPAEIKKRVLVVGGGPAGMEAARVAALRGHRVTLWEKARVLGGQVNLAAVPPGRGEFHSLIEYLARQMVALGVSVRLGMEATEENVTAFGADAVVMATGARPSMPPVDGRDGPNVAQARDVLSGRACTGKRVVIVGGGAVGCETALYLARKGTLDPESFQFLALNGAESADTLFRLATRGLKEVTILEMRKSLAADMTVTSRWIVLQDLKRYGVNTLTGCSIEKITGESVVISCGDRKEEICADTVVLAVGSKPESDLCEILKEDLKEIYLVGDAVIPRKAMDAIYEGFMAGLVL